MVERTEASPLLVVLIGVPAAGKSTLASKLKQHAGQEVEVLVIAMDDVYAEVQLKTHRTNKDFNTDTWQVARHVWHERLLQHLQGNYHRIVVADDTTHLRSMRRNCYKVARKAGAKYAQLYVPCTLELALQRNQERAYDRQIPPCCVLKHFSTIESPLQSTCPWDKVTFTCPAGTGIEKIWSELSCIWRSDDPSQVCAAETKGGQSTKHLVDLSCRQAISQAVKSTEVINRSTLAHELNVERRKYLERWRIDSDQQSPETIFKRIVHNVWLAHRQ